MVNVYCHIQSLPADTPDLTSVEEVTTIIHSLPLRKAAGPDRLSNEHLKFGSAVLPAVLAVILNAILLSRYIPISFRQGHIIPILKGQNKDPTNPANYRGITLLPVIAKVFESSIITPHRPYIQIKPFTGWFQARTQLPSHSICIS